MPKISVTVPHQLSRADATERIKPSIEKTVTDFQGTDESIEWQDDRADFRFKSLGFAIQGKVAVTDDDATVDVELPFAAMMFKDKAEQAIAKNLARVLDA